MGLGGWGGYLGPASPNQYTGDFLSSGCPCEGPGGWSWVRDLTTYPPYGLSNQRASLPRVSPPFSPVRALGCLSPTLAPSSLTLLTS